MANKKQAVLIELLSHHARKNESTSSEISNSGSLITGRASSARPNHGASLAVPSYYRRPDAVPARRFGEAESRSSGISDAIEGSVAGSAGSPDSSAVGLPSPVGPANPLHTLPTDAAAATVPLDPCPTETTRISKAYRALSNSAIHTPVVAPVTPTPQKSDTHAPGPLSSSAPAASSARLTRVLVPPTVAPPATGSVSVDEIRRRSILRDEASFVEAGAVPPSAPADTGSTGWNRTCDWLSAAGGKLWDQTCRVAGQTTQAVCSVWSSWASHESTAASSVADACTVPGPRASVPEPQPISARPTFPAATSESAGSPAGLAPSNSDPEEGDPDAVPVCAVVGDRVQLSLSLSTVGIALFCLVLLCATCYLLGRASAQPGRANRPEPTKTLPGSNPRTGDLPSPQWKPVTPSSPGSPAVPTSAGSALAGGGVSAAPGALCDSANDSMTPDRERLLLQLAAERPARELARYYVVLLAVPDHQPDGLIRLRHLQKWLLEQHEFETSLEAVYRNHWSLVSLESVDSINGTDASELITRAESLLTEYRTEAERPSDPDADNTRIGPWLRPYPWTN